MMVIEDLPRLRVRTLRNAGALQRDRKTFWTWTGVASAPSIEVTAAADAITLRDGESEVRVELRRGARQGSFTCPHCHHGARYLVFCGDWCQVRG